MPRPARGEASGPEPMLAAAVDELPLPSSLPGGCQYEPKWDGYRGVVSVDRGLARVVSRHGTDLTRAFPDVAAAAREQLVDGTIVDGELVIWRGEGLDFTELQRRVIAPTRAAGYAREAPASLVVFDLLRLDSLDATPLKLRERRFLLEELARNWRPPLQLAPATTDVSLARQWLADHQAAAAGIEGLVIKGLDQPYLPGRRAWLKLRIRETAEVLVGAVTGSRIRPERLILARRDAGGGLVVAGGTAPLDAAQATAVAALLRPPPDDHPWPALLPAGRIGAFGGPRQLPVLLVAPELVVEVEADSAHEFGRWRHLTRFGRARPDLDPDDVPRIEDFRPGATGS